VTLYPTSAKILPEYGTTIGQITGVCSMSLELALSHWSLYLAGDILAWMIDLPAPTSVANPWKRR